MLDQTSGHRARKSVELLCGAGEPSRGPLPEVSRTKRGSPETAGEIIHTHTHACTELLGCLAPRFCIFPLKTPYLQDLEQGCPKEKQIRATEVVCNFLAAGKVQTSS